MAINKLILGDNLEILKDYDVIWGDAGKVCSFQYRWAGGVDRYIAWLKERFAEIHRFDSSPV